MKAILSIESIFMTSSGVGLVKPKMILVLELNYSHHEMMRAHLLALRDTDRRLRFGMHATDDFINGYVNSFRFERDCFFGVIDSSLQIIGLAHLAYGNASSSQQHTAEFGVSVSENGRGFGVGTSLFKRSAIHARNTNISILYVHCLSSNAAMMHIARKAGMAVEYSYGEADAFLRLPPGSPHSVMLEAMQDQSAIIDYSIKQGFNRTLFNSKFLFKGTRPV
jgi:RimJ/RimL family protein N-acetyltransferase